MLRRVIAQVGALFACCLSTGTNSFNESVIVGRRRLYHDDFPGSQVCSRYADRAPGAGMATNAFFIAPSKFPNLLRRIFAERHFTQAFIILANTKSQQGRRNTTHTFIAYVSGLLTLVLALVTAGMIAAPWHLGHRPGFTDTPEEFQLTSDLLPGGPHAICA